MMSDISPCHSVVSSGRQAKVGQLGRQVGRQEDVSSSKVAVHNVLPFQKVHSLCNLKMTILYSVFCPKIVQT
jgi:hypothetical protein